ncbi:MAG: hypothetical protein GDA52_05695 [Rhodobacteraceae bacterium]|nr:hypothetical protein [Paracoccaceae bacterium]
MIPIFLGAHIHLFDRIFLLDHISAIDLRGLTIPRVETFRIALKPYLQLVYPNFLIRALKLQSEFDWIFILDADEFLLTERDKLGAMLHQCRRAPYVKLHWQNGIFQATDQITPTTALRYRYTSPERKVAANTRTIGKTFNFTPGFHRMKYGALAKINPLVGRPQTLPLPITHIPLGYTRDFAAKANWQAGFRPGRFSDYIVKKKPAHYTSACARLVDGTASLEDRLLVAAFYRSPDPSQTIPETVSCDDFERIDLPRYVDTQTARHAAAFFAQAPVAAPVPPPDLTPHEERLVALARNRVNYFTPQMEQMLTLDVNNRLIAAAA